MTTSGFISELTKRVNPIMDISLFFVIFFTGIFAGFVDAVAGGGGLIMIPALMIGGLSVSTAVATNKLCGTCGTFTSSLKFALAKNVDWHACAYMGIPAVFGSVVGSRSIGLLPKEWAEPVVLVLLIAITVFVLSKPTFGTEAAQATPVVERRGKKRIAKLATSGLVIGFHDGFFGPGAGTFLVFVLLSIGSLDFLRGTGSAKVINFLTNVTALASFVWLGLLDFPTGVVGAMGVVLGSYSGATFATKKGASAIKPLFVFVTLVLVGKLLIDLLQQ